MTTKRMIKDGAEYEFIIDDNDNIERLLIHHKSKWDTWKKRNSIVDNLDVTLDITPMSEEENQSFKKFILAKGSKDWEFSL